MAAEEQDLSLRSTYMLEASTVMLLCFVLNQAEVEKMTFQTVARAPAHQNAFMQILNMGDSP